MRDTTRAASGADPGHSTVSGPSGWVKSITRCMQGDRTLVPRASVPRLMFSAEMLDPTTTHARLTRHSFGGSSSSAKPMQPAWAWPCVLDHLGLARPRTHVAAASNI